MAPLAAGSGSSETVHLRRPTDGALSCSVLMERVSRESRLPTRRPQVDGSETRHDLVSDQTFVLPKKPVSFPVFFDCPFCESVFLRSFLKVTNTMCICTYVCMYIHCSVMYRSNGWFIELHIRLCFLSYMSRNRLKLFILTAGYRLRPGYRISGGSDL